MSATTCGSVAFWDVVSPCAKEGKGHMWPRGEMLIHYYILP